MLFPWCTLIAIAGKHISDVRVILEINVSADKDLPVITPCLHYWKRYYDF